MATGLKKVLDNLKDACELHAIPLELIGGDGVNICNSIVIDGYQIDNIRSFDAEDINMMVDLLINYDMDDLKNVFRQENASMSQALGEYVKDSYNYSRDKLSNIFKQALKGCSYAVNKFETLKDVRVSHVYTTNSAFLYNGYYITPCILQSVINEGLRMLNPSSMSMYMDVYGYNKKDYKGMTKDIMDDYFMNNTMDRLTMIDELLEGQKEGV